MGLHLQPWDTVCDRRRDPNTDRVLARRAMVPGTAGVAGLLHPILVIRNQKVSTMSQERSR
ncbi:Uncharacterised protein [Mycobacterium tuberculosis]|nr:Uncharacterised protein [Mycobacterium tuberculosis]